MAALDTDTSEFDLQRKRAEQQVNAQKQGQQDALKRRFAAMGNINSGAYIKANENVDTNASNTLQNANEGINAAQTGELRRRREVLQGQEFAAGEAEKGRRFSSSESALGRAFATQERMGGQEFQTGMLGKQQDFAAAQADAQRKYQTGERMSSQDFALMQSKSAQDFTEKQNAMSRGLTAEQINNQKDQFQKQYELDKSTTDFNKQMAEAEANRPGGLLGSLFGNVGGSPDSPLGKLLGGGQNYLLGTMSSGGNPIGGVASVLGGGSSGGGFW